MPPVPAALADLHTKLLASNMANVALSSVYSEHVMMMIATAHQLANPDTDAEEPLAEVAQSFATTSALLRGMADAVAASLAASLAVEKEMRALIAAAAEQG